MSNGLPDPDSLLTPGWTPVDTVNCVLNGLNHTANGLNGPEFILFPMMAIANDHLRYQTSVCSLVHTHSLTHESRRLRFPQILPFPPPPTLLHLPASYRLPRVRKPVTFSVRRVEESRVPGAECIWNPAHIPLFRLPQDSRFLSSLPTDALRLPLSKEVPPSSLVGVCMLIS